jgi:hypothetical protein
MIAGWHATPERPDCCHCMCQAPAANTMPGCSVSETPVSASTPGMPPLLVLSSASPSTTACAVCSVSLPQHSCLGVTSSAPNTGRPTQWSDCLSPARCCPAHPSCSSAHPSQLSLCASLNCHATLHACAVSCQLLLRAPKLWVACWGHTALPDISCRPPPPLPCAWLSHLTCWRHDNHLLSVRRHSSSSRLDYGDRWLRHSHILHRPVPPCASLCGGEHPRCCCRCWEAMLGACSCCMLLCGHQNDN